MALFTHHQPVLFHPEHTQHGFIYTPSTCPAPSRTHTAWLYLHTINLSCSIPNTYSMALFTHHQPVLFHPEHTQHGFIYTPSTCPVPSRTHTAWLYLHTINLSCSNPNTHSMASFTHHQPVLLQPEHTQHGFIYTPSTCPAPSRTHTARLYLHTINQHPPILYYNVNHTFVYFR